MIILSYLFVYMFGVCTGFAMFLLYVAIVVLNEFKKPNDQNGKKKC